MSDYDIFRSVASALGVTGSQLTVMQHIVHQESSGNAHAHSRTSSAAGMWQFVRQTWLQELKAHGAQYGLGALASHIVIGSDGRATVDDPKLEQQILDLRYDPTVSTQMMVELTKSNSAQLEKALGHAPSAGEIYLAHFAGAGAAVSVLQAAKSQPELPISKLLGQEVIEANASIKFRGKSFASFTAGDLEAWSKTRMGIDIDDMIAYDRETFHTDDEKKKQEQIREDALRDLGWSQDRIDAVKPFILFVGVLLQIIQAYNASSPTGEQVDYGASLKNGTTILKDVSPEEAAAPKTPLPPVTSAVAAGGKAPPAAK